MSRWSVYAVLVLVYCLTACQSVPPPKDPLQRLRDEALAGELQAQLELAAIHASGDGAPVDPEESLRWYRAAAEQGSMEGAFGAAGWLLQGGPARRAEAIEFLQQGADAGHAPSLTRLADSRMEDYPERTEAATEAFTLYAAAAGKGLDEAQYKLAGLYLNGVGVARDLQSAAQWYRRSAEQGNADAQLALGNAYLTGIGVPPSVVEALDWYERSARQGEALAQSNLGDLLTLERYGSIRDFGAGARWYQLSAEQNHAHAQARLGRLYERGEGVERDPQQAARWYLAAAEQGNANAQCRLGSLYLRGLGVPQSNTEADRWFNRAAAQVPAGVLPLLGFIYYDCDQFDVPALASTAAP